MYTQHYQSTSYHNSYFNTLKNTPQLQPKSYSFKDPLFQSFGNGYLSKNDLTQKQTHLIRQQNHHESPNQDQCEILEETLQMSEKFALMSNLLKISKSICSPSVLLVNTQSKAKTQVILKSKQNNEDQGSQILCENANKYLNFIEFLKIQQLKYPFTQKVHSMIQDEVKINLESRIQNQTLPFSSESRNITNSNPYSQDLTSKYQHSLSYHLQKSLFANQSLPYSKQKQYQSQQNTSFVNPDHSKNIISDQKQSHATYTSQNADRMFQRIQTPKIYQNHSNQNPFFTPFQENDLSQSKNKDSKLQKKKFRKFQKEPESSRVSKTQKTVQNSSFKERENTHNQKMHKELRIDQNEGSRKSSQVKKDLNRSLSSKNQSFVSQSKAKQEEKLIGKGKKQKIKIGKNMKKDESKNLAIKVLDKTSQFQKMLRMTSSRLNET